MSYRKEEKQIQWKLRRIRAIVLAVVFFIVIAIGIFSAFVPPNTWKYYFDNPSVPMGAEGELRMHFIDVGQGDCTLIELPDDKKMLIDGGNGAEANNTKIIRYLNALQIDRLDYVVLTHSDSDHCGGLPTVIDNKEIGAVYYPLEDNAAINSSYASFFQKIAEGTFEKKINRRGLTITSSDDRYPYQITWLWPYGADNPGATPLTGNDKSAIVWLSYGDNQALFMGDASSAIEEKLILHDTMGFLSPFGVDISSIELLKVAHHGSADGTSPAFLTHTQTKNAIISCGKNNVYEHPSAQTMTNLSNAQISVYRTDEDGNVLVSWQPTGSQSVIKGY